MGKKKTMRQVWIDSDVRRKIRVIAAEQDKSMQQVLRDTFVNPKKMMAEWQPVRPKRMKNEKKFEFKL